MNLKQELKTEAHRLGFLLAGVALPEKPRHYSTYANWLAAGRHASMAYLANERARARRADFHLILPEVKSILCLALPYPHQRKELPFDPSKGNVAAYAAATVDYHDIIPPRLEILVSFMETHLERTIEWRGYTDTGPVLERDLAMAAGLGWIGRNTCLISPQAGSYFLLAEILWDVELEPDQPQRHDFCGSCRRCVEACPTDCILPDRTLDARRCISFLTIENKTEIDPDLRTMLGNWVFGCDICQQVCPWNIRFAVETGDAEFVPQPEGQSPDLVADLHLSPHSFNQKFHLSPVLRSKRRGYLRNIAVALGNSKNPAAVPALQQSLTNESEPMVRAHSAWALGQIGGPQALACLNHARTQETDASVLIEIEGALNKLLGDPSPRT